MRFEDHCVCSVEVIMFLMFSPGQTQKSEYLQTHTVHKQTVTGEVAFVSAVYLPHKFISQTKKKSERYHLSKDELNADEYYEDLFDF